jgi:molybdopterin-binding protein
MKYGARNALTAKVKSVKKGDIMSLVKFEVTAPAEMASVLTTESLEDLKMKKGDQVQI